MKIKQLLQKKRRGSIMVVFVFSVFVAILMLGMMRVGLTLYANGRAQESEYADIQTYRSIAEVACYQYVKDLMACVATRNVSADMPGTAESVIYDESIMAIQQELAYVPTPKPEHWPYLEWRIQDATLALGATELSGDPVMVSLLEPLISGGSHTFQLTLTSDLALDYDSADNYYGVTESYIALRPFEVQVKLKIKSEVILTTFEVYNLFLDVVRHEMPTGDGGSYLSASMRIIKNPD